MMWSESGFQLESKGGISLRSISDLKSHEEVEERTVDRLARSIATLGVQIDPIVIDRRSGVVLDGMHRLAALKRMGALRIAAFCPDYDDPGVRVARWFRLVSRISGRMLDGIIKDFPLTNFSGGDILRAVEESKAPVGLLTSNGSYAPTATPGARVDGYDLVKRFDELAARRGLKVRFVPDSGTVKKVRAGSALLVTPTITKSDVVAAALTKNLFPRKTTRHVLPLRPLSLDVPLELLSGGVYSVREAQSKLLEFLRASQYELKGPGEKYKGRFYEERIAIFRRRA